jgi:hypothetical protein
MNPITVYYVSKCFSSLPGVFESYKVSTAQVIFILIVNLYFRLISVNLSNVGKLSLSLYSLFVYENSLFGLILYLFFFWPF